LLSKIHIVPVDELVAQRFGTLKAHLRSIGQIVPDFDLLIASTALVYGYSVVTHNTRHFVRIPGLVVVDRLA
jgi:tRNA(fMet)-specific endonuclease VapC